MLWRAHVATSNRMNTNRFHRSSVLSVLCVWNAVGWCRLVRSAFVCFFIFFIFFNSIKILLKVITFLFGVGTNNTATTFDHPHCVHGIKSLCEFRIISRSKCWWRLGPEIGTSFNFASVMTSRVVVGMCDCHHYALSFWKLILTSVLVHW